MALGCAFVFDLVAILSAYHSSLSQEIATFEARAEVFENVHEEALADAIGNRRSFGVEIRIRLDKGRFVFVLVFILRTWIHLI